MDSLLVANIPHDCDHDEILSWLEHRGVRIAQLRLISDLVTGTSPAFAQVQLVHPAESDKIAKNLDGQRLRERALRVKSLKLEERPKLQPFLKASA
jgi:hypothetical protein